MSKHLQQTYSFPCIYIYICMYVYIYILFVRGVVRGGYQQGAGKVAEDDPSSLDRGSSGSLIGAHPRHTCPRSKHIETLPARRVVE